MRFLRLPQIFSRFNHYIHFFNRHTLIDDSHETKITEKKRRNKPKLEDPAGTNGLGGLLRRLSKRDRDRGMDMQRHPGGDGEDNFGFDMEAPKSPWRYPHLMFRTDSRKNKAVSFKQNPGIKKKLKTYI